MFLTASLLLLAVTPPALPEPLTRARYVMGTVCEITASSDHAIDAAFAEGIRIENELLSTWKGESELARLNSAGAATVSPELWDLLAIAREWSDRTGGAFNPLVRPLIDCWQTRGTGAVPDAITLASARAKTAIGNLTMRAPRTILLAHGATIEEGAFGKGYALDRMLALLPEEANPILNFGGQISVRGSATVTIADPRRRDRAIVELTLTNASLSTSSGSEKFFVAGGRRFSHILDPRTGEALPPRGSVSVIANSGLEADILSTALYVMGDADGLRWADAHDAAALFVGADNAIHLSRRFRQIAAGFSLLDSHVHVMADEKRIDEKE